MAILSRCLVKCFLQPTVTDFNLCCSAFAALTSDHHDIHIAECRHGKQNRFGGGCLGSGQAQAICPLFGDLLPRCEVSHAR
eukprot:1379397-Amphidinium_carterae.1